MKKGNSVRNDLLDFWRKWMQDARVELCRKHDFSDAFYYKWKARFREQKVFDTKRPRLLEEENNKLLRLLTAALLDNAALKDVISRKW